MKLARLVGIGLLVLSLSAGMLYAAPGDGPKGPKPKLAAPTNVTCPLTVDGVLVSWDAVADANAYQVEYICVNALGEFNDESVFILASPVLLDDEDCTAILAVHVRAMPAPKSDNPDHPVQGTGPKGLWSESCVVEVPLPL